MKKWHNRSYRWLQLYNKVLPKVVVKWFPCNKSIRLLPQDQGLILMSEELATLFSLFLIGTICIWHLCWKLKVPMAGRMRKRFSGQHWSKFDPPTPILPLPWVLLTSLTKSFFPPNLVTGKLAIVKWMCREIHQWNPISIHSHTTAYRQFLPSHQWILETGHCATQVPGLNNKVYGGRKNIAPDRIRLLKTSVILLTRF